MKGGPAFHRVRAFAALLTAALATGLSMPGAIAEVGGDYKSRGHGRGKYSGRKVTRHVCNNGGRHKPHQSTRECQRRLRQMARDQRNTMRKLNDEPYSVWEEASVFTPEQFNNLKGGNRA